MLCVWLSALLLGAVSGQGADIEDFDDKLNNYEFVYHDLHDLLVIIHGNTCYYLDLPDIHEFRIQTDEAKRQAELFLITLIEGNTEHNVKSTTLEDMRLKYSDLLADYRCSGHDIKTLEVLPQDYPYAHTPPPQPPHIELHWWNWFHLFGK